MSRGGDFGSNWRAKRWMETLEQFRIGARLSRGRSYARRGQVLSIDIQNGVVEAQVQGRRRATPAAITAQTRRRALNVQPVNIQNSCVRSPFLPVNILIAATWMVKGRKRPPRLTCRYRRVFPQIGCAEGIPEPLRDFAERVARSTEHVYRITGADIDTYLYECDLIFNEDERQKFAHNAKRYIENSGAFSEPLALCLDWARTATPASSPRWVLQRRGLIDAPHTFQRGQLREPDHMDGDVETKAAVILVGIFAPFEPPEDFQLVHQSFVPINPH